MREISQTKSVIATEMMIMMMMMMMMMMISCQAYGERMMPLCVMVGYFKSPPKTASNIMDDVMQRVLRGALMPISASHMDCN